MPSIGQRLLRERERLGLTQPDLADVCGVTMRSQRNYEKGERQPDAAYLAAIATAGADVLYILTGQRSGVVLSPDECELLALFRAAPLAVKAAAIGALRGGSGKAPARATKIAVGANYGQVVEGGLVNRGDMNFGAKPSKK